MSLDVKLPARNLLLAGMSRQQVEEALQHRPEGEGSHSLRGPHLQEDQAVFAA